MELKELLESIEEGPGESRAKGVFGLGGSESPCRGQVGWKGSRRKNTLAAQEALGLPIFAASAIWIDVMVSVESVNRIQKHHLSLQDRKSADSGCSFT